ncbi:MAG: serine hydrolase, partial [Planctomycetota bacterium]
MLSAAAALLCLQGAPDPGFLEARRTLDAAISAGTIPGACLVVGRGAEVLHRSAHGEREPGVPMTLDTVFDLASV